MPPKPTSAPATPAAEPTPTTTSSILRIPTEKISSLIRLTSQRSKPKPPPIVFPPPSWQLDESQNNGAGASDVPDEPGIPKNIAEDAVRPEDAPEPGLFAQRISTLIDSLPPPPEAPKDGQVGENDPRGPPLPLSVTSDSKLMKLLSSESVMNGSIEAGRQSVWYMLDGLERLKGRLGGDKAPEAGKGASSGNEDEREDGGIMMYTPLQPTADSQVELADSEMVLEYLDEPTEEEKATTASKTPVQDANTKPPLTSKNSTSSKTATGPKKQQRVKEHVRWMPSPTQISLQAMWWGYRLYLPPPVMALLDDTHLAAARRGAMITASLKYMLDKIPLMLLPPQARPAVMVLKRLSPYLGYLSVFIAWSWTAIKARDKGDGVVLTATWLLPVALVPAPLKGEDFQKRGVAGASTATKPDPKTGDKSVTDASASAKTAAAKPASAKTPDAKSKAPTSTGASKKAGDGKKTGDPEEPESLARRWTTALGKKPKPAAEGTGVGAGAGAGVAEGGAGVGAGK
ncbi:hypothetical protein C8R46DRAFT_1008478 [Mycena filopes]|nr:hypothetical protein C8R46DRAFT_1008478 [Mycena filopes]